MLRALSAEDASVCASIHAESFDRAWSEADMLDHIEKDIALGWFDDKRLAGFIFIQRAADQAEILTVAVKSECRRMGVGLKLVQHGAMTAQEEGANILFLEVAEDNGAAITLYKTAGFENFGRRRGYYKRENGRVAALLFRKNLRPSA